MRGIRQKPLIKWILPVAAIMMLAWYVSEYRYQLMLIQGNSMYPELHNMQLVVLDKHSGDYRAGDVIAFRCEGLSAVLVKRVAAVPGDSVVISGGTLYVNGQTPDFYGDAVFEYAGLLGSETVLGEGEYIVIGDNIPESKDSRYGEVGIVRLDDITGSVAHFP